MMWYLNQHNYNGKAKWVRLAVALASENLIDDLHRGLVTVNLNEFEHSGYDGMGDLVDAGYENFLWFDDGAPIIHNNFAYYSESEGKHHTFYHSAIHPTLM